MIEKKTIIDQFEVTQGGEIRIRFALQLIEDGNIIGSSWHRTVIEPGVDVDAQIEAVNDHLLQMGKKKIDRAMLPQLKAVAAVIHTEEVVSQFRGRKARQDQVV